VSREEELVRGSGEVTSETRRQNACGTVDVRKRKLDWHPEGKEPLDILGCLPYLLFLFSPKIETPTRIAQTQWHALLDLRSEKLSHVRIKKHDLP
jgi:hypothetical protein